VHAFFPDRAYVPAAQSSHRARDRSRFPAAHVTQLLSVDILPISQRLHTVAPAEPAYVPPPHAAHADVRRVVVEKVPTAHGVQAEAPLPAAYVPAPQSRHAELSLEYRPRAHAAHALPATSWPFPHTTASQEVLAALAANPSLQGEHAEADVPDMVPDAQGSHPAAPGLLVNLPAVHALQDVMRSVSWYWPAGHAPHTASLQPDLKKPATQELHLASDTNE